MKATRIIAIRHGETAWNVDTRIQGQLDIPLNERGQWQAAQLAEALATQDPLDAVYTSDLKRAHQTASAVAARQGLTPVSHVGLRERGFGAFEGKTFAEIEKDLPEDALLWRKREPHWAPPQGGESLVLMEKRIRNTLNELAAQHVGQHIALFAHGGVMDLLYRIATQQGLQAPRTWTLTNTAINRLLWTPESVSLVGWADTSHLDEMSRDEH
ncbi:MAG: Phosphoserine phosphatase 1 [Pseudomonadota bacterium]|jgi:probable phosphoglycerate mutase